MAIKKIKLPDNSEVSVQDSRVPDVTGTDNGKYLGVSSGVWAALSKPSYTLDEVSDGSTRKLADYLPLTAGSAKSLTDSLYITLSATDITPIIRATAGTSNISYLDIRTSDNKTTNLGFVSSSTWGVPDAGGAYIFVANNDSAGGIFVNGGGLYYTDTDTDLDKYTVYHSGNSNAPAVPWTCSTLTASASSVSNSSTTDAFAAVTNTASYSSYTPVLALLAPNISQGGLPYIRIGKEIAANNSAWLGFEYIGSGSPNNKICFGFDGNIDKLLTIMANGNVGVNTPSPTERLHVIGNILASGAITPGSDSRIKDNQKDISQEIAFSVIEKLKPKTWVWNEKSNENLNGKSAAGLVAQEVKEFLPDAVTISDIGDIKDFHSLNYNMIQGYEIAAIKGLIEEVKELREEIERLKNG